MSDDTSTPFGWRVAGGVAVALGAAVFLVRLKHPGAYAMPSGGALLGALTMLAWGGWLLAAGGSRTLRWLALAVAIVPLYLAVYGFLAEWEEVVVVYAPDASGETQALRLWIVDDASGSWLAMPGAKADAHGLTDVELPMLRNGEERCARIVRSDDYADLVRTSKLRDQKYAIQRLANAVGVFSAEPPKTSTALRVEACGDSAERAS